jgi:hypothetical protein
MVRDRTPECNRAGLRARAFALALRAKVDDGVMRITDAAVIQRTSREKD